MESMLDMETEVEDVDKDGDPTKYIMDNLIFEEKDPKAQ